MTITELRDLFIELTRVTMPYGTERELFKPFAERLGLESDEFGNYIKQIGDSKTIFTCHIDTVGKGSVEVEHFLMTRIKDGRIGLKSDGSTILGADDKAGVCVLFNMISNNVPGLYYFFLGEEGGAHGSTAALKLMGDKVKDYNRVISFDRRGYSSVITEQGKGRCCSEQFAEALAAQLNSKNEEFSFKADPTGVFTDSAIFMNSVSECTNISVGYFNEHTNNETLDLQFLHDLSEAVLTVDWENLPVVRDHTEVNQKTTFSYKFRAAVMYTYAGMMYVIEECYPNLIDKVSRKSEKDILNKLITLFDKTTDKPICSVLFTKKNATIYKNGKYRTFKELDGFEAALCVGELDKFLDHKVVDKETYQVRRKK